MVRPVRNIVIVGGGTSSGGRSVEKAGELGIEDAPLLLQPRLLQRREQMPQRKGRAA